jgi:cytochrome c553
MPRPANPKSVDSIKAAARARDGYRCTKCGMTDTEHKARHGATLDVHRVVPGSAYTLAGVVTLCRPCHGPEPRSPYRSYPPGSRFIILTQEVVRTAISLRALRTGKDNSDVVNDILRDALADEIEEASKFPHTTGKKRGRKKKGGGE